MEKSKSSPSDSIANSGSAAKTTSNAIGTPKFTSSRSSPPHDHDQYRRRQDFASNFTSLYHSIPPQKSPFPCSSISPSASSSSSNDFQLLLDPIPDDIATERHLNQARLILEYHQICQHYDLCLDQLQILCRDLEALRIENADLRLTNSELVQLVISLSSQKSMKQNLRNEQISNLNKQSSWKNTTKMECSSLPKSMSVRSSGYLKVNKQEAPPPSRMRVAAAAPLLSRSVQQRVHVPAGDQRDEEAWELDVYNQGMVKTELCNKWKETGSCPYGDHCQFAHGICELRPVIRHPRYKTEVCKMTLAGKSCPYGHRCHFRHSLTDQERRLLLSR